MKFSIKKTVFFSLLAWLLVGPLALAQQPTLANTGQLDQQDVAFFNSAGLPANVSLTRMIANIIEVALSFVGVILIILIIYAGFLWMTSAGNQEKISKARKIMVAAVVGVVIVFSAYAITVFVIDRILEFADLHDNSSTSGQSTGIIQGSN